MSSSFSVLLNILSICWNKCIFSFAKTPDLGFSHSKTATLHRCHITTRKSGAIFFCRHCDLQTTYFRRFLSENLIGEKTYRNDRINPLFTYWSRILSSIYLLSFFSRGTIYLISNCKYTSGFAFLTFMLCIMCFKIKFEKSLEIKFERIQSYETSPTQQHKHATNT